MEFRPVFIRFSANLRTFDGISTVFLGQIWDTNTNFADLSLTSGEILLEVA